MTEYKGFRLLQHHIYKNTNLHTYHCRVKLTRFLTADCWVQR